MAGLIIIKFLVHSLCVGGSHTTAIGKENVYDL